MHDVSQRHIAADKRLPAKTYIYGQMGGDFPGVLPIESQVVVTLVVVLNSTLREGTRITNEEIGHGKAGHRAVKSEFAIAIERPIDVLNRADPVHAECQLVVSFH